MNYSNKVSACIVTYNSSKKIGEAVSSIKMYTKGVDYKLYIFDNGSTDNTKEIALEADNSVIFTENNANLGFGKANNLVLDLIDSKYHAIINPDIRINSDVISEICNYMDEHPDVALATPKILFPDGTEQHLPKLKPRMIYLLARRTPLFKKKAIEYTMENIKIEQPTEIDQCTGCFAIIKSEVFKKIGGFDERFFMYMEDADLTIRAKEYGKTMFLPQFSVIHEWERSSSKSLKYMLIHISSMFKFIWKHKRK